MPDTTLLHLLTGHTVRTTSTVQAASTRSSRPRCRSTDWPSKDAHGHVVYLRPEHVTLVESEEAGR